MEINWFFVIKDYNIKKFFLYNVNSENQITKNVKIAYLE